MPYISDWARRTQLDSIVEMMQTLEIKADGDLNYILFKYFKNNVEKGYNPIKNYCGELTEAAGQIREEFLYPYEAQKKLENGDV